MPTRCTCPSTGDPVATGMGNPHCTFFVEDAEAVDLPHRGAALEHHPLFPERTNVQFARSRPDRLRMRVWERGVGITLASGSSSCAVAVAAARRGLTGAHGDHRARRRHIAVDWRDDGVWMTGPTAHVFDGALTRRLPGRALMTAARPSSHTLGCRLNAYETEAMKELAAAAGVDDAVVVNTCAVTAEAVRKARQEIRRLRRDNPGAA
jgi:hypothetical protein